MKLKLVKTKLESSNAKSFFFSSEEKIFWEPGQYAYITLGNITKQFTIASSPTEEFIQITTNINKYSEFKQNFESLKIGDEIESRLPFGSFILPTINSSLSTINFFLAGGLGITPFRSMIKYNIDNKLGIKMHLVYSQSVLESEFIFKEELDNWQKEYDFIKIKYINSSVEGRIDKTKIEEIIANWKLNIGNCAFSAVGPHAFVNSMEDILADMNVSSDKISTEKFTGY